MKPNYEAWNLSIDVLSSPREFIKAAVLAPSSHNSQPWVFSTPSDDSIVIEVNPERRLRESDTNDRQAIISLGAAVKNIELVADYHGYNCRREEDQGREARVRLTFSRSEHTPTPRVAHLALTIPKRSTNRSPHAAQPLTPDLLKEIQNLASDDVHITLVTDPVQVQDLGTIAVDAGIAALDDAGFRLELSQYLKPNGTGSFIGMPGSGFGFPTPMALVAPTLIRFFNMERPMRRQNIALFKRTASLLLLSTARDTWREWIEVGRVYQHIALTAAAHGASTAPWAAAVQIGEFHKSIEQNIPLDMGRLQFFARLGFPTLKTSHSPRLEARHVTI